MSRLRKIKIDPYLILLLIISVFLCYQNYTPNTFLSGWDSLHPEFNLRLYLSRITSVWQSHQGLGAPPSQAHLAELPRMILIGLFCLIFPMNFVRYAYFFLMIIIGPLGVYLLVKYLFCRSKLASFSAFFASLFYLLNLGTMQHFIAPLEMFATKFGFLGFLYLTALRFLDKGKKRDLVLFAVFTILASPMAHTATLWYVYFIGLLAFALFYSILKKRSLKKALILILLTLLLNLYWIMPNIYYSLNHGGDVITSKIHRLTSEETYYYNKKYGNFSSFMLFKNFLFDWWIVNKTESFSPLLEAWSTHLKYPLVLFCGYLFSVIAIIGLLLSFVRRNKNLLLFIPITILSSFFLLLDMPIVNTVLDRLREASPLLKEVIRSPFTKFSIYAIFCYSIFFGYSNLLLMEKIASKAKSRVFNLVLIIYFYVLLSLFLFFSLPAFQGNFISSIVRVKIPQDYFSLFQWSKNQDNERMLILPMHSLYGWVYYDWNLRDGTKQVYQGAGFSWFGLKQPTLNREFDRWYPYNEQAYREFYYAIYSQNQVLFQKLLDKYRIKYILLDENVFIPQDAGNDAKLFYPQIKQLLANLNDISASYGFGEKLILFQRQTPNEDGKIQNLYDYKNINPGYRWNYVDQAYLDNSSYITDSSQSVETLTYPERNILTAKERINKNVLPINKDLYYFNINAPPDQGRSVKIPDIAATEKEFYADIYIQKYEKNNRLIIKYLLPFLSDFSPLKQIISLDNQANLVTINGQGFLLPGLINQNEVFLGEAVIKLDQPNNLTFTKNGIEQKIDYNDSDITSLLVTNSKGSKLTGVLPKEQALVKIKNLNSQINDCSLKKSEFINKKLINLDGQDIIEYQSTEGTICDQISFPDLSQKTSYILAVESKNISGLPIKLCVENFYTKTCILEDELTKNKSFDTDYFIIPSYGDFSGYKIILSNQSIGRLLTVNQIKSLRMIPFPDGFIRSISWGIGSNSNLPTVIYNNQAYEPGWKAYVGGVELKDHVLVDNWANGWKINAQSGNIVIIFWPQYLEYLGFILLSVGLIYIFRYR